MIVRTWFVPTALVAVAGLIAMFASTHFFDALPPPPAVVFTAVAVVRVIACPSTVIVEVAETVDVPVVVLVIVTVQLAVAAPPA